MKIALVLTSALALAIAPDLARGKGDTESKDKGKDNTLTGCLSKSTTGTEGSYTLTTKNKEVDVRGAQLAEHVGHEVKLSGSWMNEAAHGGASATTTTDKQATRTDKGSPRHFMVSDIQHIAATCTTKQEMKQQKHETKQDTKPEKQDKPQKQY